MGKQNSAVVTGLAALLIFGGMALGTQIPVVEVDETTTTFHIILAHPITRQTTTTMGADPTASTVTVTTEGGGVSTTGGTSSPSTSPPTTSAPLTVDVTAEQIIAASTDQIRVSAGLDPVVTDSGLHAYARAWASHMAETGVFTHSDISALLAQGWQVVGENLAQGPDASAVVQALIESPSHLDIIIDPLFTSDGVGVVVDEQGELWVVQVFAGEELVPTTTTVTIPVDTTLPAVTTPTLPDVTTTIITIP